jgi:hypothetical protein
MKKKLITICPRLKHKQHTEQLENLTKAFNERTLFEKPESLSD